MTREQFKSLPYLLTLGQVAACGYAEATVSKYAEHGLLLVVQPTGCHHRRFQKRQVAELLGWERELDWQAWTRERPLLGLAAVLQWTGYSKGTVRQIIAAGGLRSIQPGGIGESKYRKDEIASWIGL